MVNIMGFCTASDFHFKPFKSINILIYSYESCLTSLPVHLWAVKQLFPYLQCCSTSSHICCYLSQFSIWMEQQTQWAVFFLFFVSWAQEMFILTFTGITKLVIMSQMSSLRPFHGTFYTDDDIFVFSTEAFPYVKNYVKKYAHPGWSCIFSLWFIWKREKQKQYKIINTQSVKVTFRWITTHLSMKPDIKHRLLCCETSNCTVCPEWR